MPRKQLQWGKENPLGRQTRKVLEDSYQKGLLLRSDLLAGKYSVGQADGLIFVWQNNLQSALFMADQGVLSGSSVYRFIMPFSLDSSVNYVTREAGDSRLAKMLGVIDALLNGTFEPEYPDRTSVHLVFDGESLFDKDDHHLRLAVHKGSKAYRILRFFFRYPSRKELIIFQTAKGLRSKRLRSVEESIVIEFGADDFRAWKHRLADAFHCTNDAILDVIKYEGNRIIVSEKFSII